MLRIYVYLIERDFVIAKWKNGYGTSIKMTHTQPRTPASKHSTFFSEDAVAAAIAKSFLPFGFCLVIFEM